jgi:hypothetical protein
MIYLTQWLCPSRHALIAIPWDPKDTREEDVIAIGEEFLTGRRTVTSKDLMDTQGAEEFLGHKLEKRCGICDSKDIHTETGKTKYTNVQEAQAGIQKLQRINMVARQILTERRN